jgi:hypothetical protein
MGNKKNESLHSAMSWFRSISRTSGDDDDNTSAVVVEESEIDFRVYLNNVAISTGEFCRNPL